MSPTSKGLTEEFIEGHRLMVYPRNYWAADWSGLDVGHRGLGNSYTQVTQIAVFMRY